MLSNLSNNNSGNQTKSVVEKKHYEDIEKRLDEMQDEIEMTEQGVSTNSQAITSLDGRVAAVEDNSTFPDLNTDAINPIHDKVQVTSDLDVIGTIHTDNVKTGALTVNGTSFTTVKDDAAQAKSIAENAENKADEAYSLADAVADELADYKADNEQSITTGTLNADSVVTDSIAAQTINTNDFETTNAEIDKLYVDTIKATGFLELPTSGQSYYTITVPAKTTASFSGVYTSDNNTDFPFYFTVSDGAVIYKQNSTEIIKDISFDRETGYTKVRVKSSTNLTYISSALDSNPVTIEDGGAAYADYVFIPQKTGGYLIRGYDDTTTEVYIAGVLKAYALSIEEEIIERTSVDFLKVNASIELPKEWDAGGTISYSTGEENQYISAQKKAGVIKPTWTSPIHSTIGSLSYSSKLVDEATIASYKGISETRQTQTISITEEASLQQLTAFHWTKNGTYWQPYELTRITIGDNTMWIDPTEANQGIRFYDNHVIADGTWDDTPVEEANAVPVNLVIFDAPTELSFPITNLGDKTTVHGEITATCFKGNVLGNVTGNADTATNATCFSNKIYAEAKADILSGCAADSNKFNGKTYSEACADILSGNAATATNATCFDGHTYECAKADILSGCAASADNATCFDGCTYAQAKADILSGNAASATNATCFNGCTYSQAKADILSGNAATATNAACFGGCTYAQAKSDILSGTAAQAHCVDIDSLTTNSYPLVMESTTCELGKSGTCPITFAPSTGILETNQVSTNCIENSGTTKSQYLCATCDINVDGNAYITGDLTVQGTITTTHSEEVVTPSENIILRDGATTPIASGCYSGFTVTNYDGENNNLEVGADKDGTLHVGVVGETMEPIATRATEACMEDGYAAHWDSTGTDLVTKGASCTHDLNVNGNLSVTGNASITGTLTADLTGTADNATKFDNKTYAEACADILAGCACAADDATCFNGCTYACAKADILSGCAADSAKLGNKAASCYLDNSSTAQTKAGNLSIGAPAACTSTSAGGNGNILGSTGIDIYGSTSLPHIHFHNNKYCGEYSARIANTTGRVALTVNNGTGCTAATESKIFDFCSNGTFTGATNICGTNIYQSGNKVIDTSSAYQTKAGTLCIGAPTACTSTSAGGQGAIISNAGVIALYRNSCPYVDFHYQKYCGEFSSRITNLYATNSCNGVLRMTINNGKGCTASDTTANFDFYSDGTFTGACTICASTNIYSADCPVVTTGTLPTVAPGYNCTGTSNYVVTTMVCCARAIRRNQATTGTCHLALFAGTSDASNANMYVSNACELTYQPATGLLSTKCIRACTDSFHTQLQSPNGSTKYITLKLGNANGYAEFTSNVDIYVYDNHVNFSIKVSVGVVTLNEISKTVDYGINQYLLGEYDDTNKTVTIYLKFTNYREANIVSSSPIVEASVSSTAPTGTFVDIPYANRTSYINTSSSNAEYPLVFSTCCATPAAGNSTLYNDSANNLMYNPSTNTLTACCVRGSTSVKVGNPTSCTSTQAGAGGATINNNGTIESYSATPVIDLHVNYACADYSHRLIANNGYLRVTATNATGCCAATQTANFDFCSDGTFCANAVRVGQSYRFTSEKSNNSGRPVIFLLTDITCAVCCSTTSASIIGKAYRNRFGSGQILTNGSIEFDITMPYGSTGVENTTASTHLRCGSSSFPVVVTKSDGCAYAGLVVYGSAQAVTFDMMGSSGVICQVCADANNVYKDASGCTFTIAKTGSLTEITSCVSNAVLADNSTCFGGCTYAQAKADILAGNAGSANKIVSDTVEIVGCNCNSDTLLCINPTTDHCCIFIGSVLPYSGAGLDNYIPVAIGCNNCVLAGVAIGTCSCSDGGVAIGQYTKAWRGGPTASGNAVAIGYGVMSEDAGVAIGGGSKACRRAVAIGHGAQVCCSCGFGVAIGPTSIAGQAATALGHFTTACDYATALGEEAKAVAEGSLAIGRHACSEIICDIRYSTIVTMDSSVYGRHGEIDITIPSCLVKCDIWKGLCSIYHSMNNGRTLCSWTCSSCTDIPIMRSSFFGYVWDAAGTTDGTKRYSSGVDATGTCYGNFNVILDDQSCLNYTLAFMLGACHCPIEIGNMRFDRSDTSTWICGLSGKIIF